MHPLHGFHSSPSFVLGRLETFRDTIRSQPLWLPVIAGPDPDGFGANVGKMEIIRQLGVDADWPYYAGGIDDPQNRHILRTLGLSEVLRPLSELPAHGVITLNDSCRLDDNRFGMEIDPDRIWDITDHHLPPSGSEPLMRPWRFVHLVPSVGAASTLVVEQGRACGTRFSPQAAALLALGIYCDTNKLRSPVTTDFDRRAFAAMAALADQRQLAECHDYPLDDRFYDLTAKTYLGRRIIGPVLVSHPSRRVHGSESGIVSRNANSLRQYSACPITLVWCLTESEVRFSVRANDPNYDLTALIDKIFGRRFGGAKPCEGGGQIPISEFPVDPRYDFDDEMIAKISAWIEQRLVTHFKAIAP